MLDIFFLTWVMTSGVISFGTTIALLLKWKKDDDDIFEIKYLMVLICLTTVCIFLLLPIYLIENKIDARISKAYQAVKRNLHS
jgi:hypothetical protein